MSSTETYTLTEVYDMAPYERDIFFSFLEEDYERMQKDRQQISHSS